MQSLFRQGLDYRQIVIPSSLNYNKHQKANYKNYIMGCGSFITQNYRKESTKISLEEREKIIRQKLQSLKPSKLVDQQMLDNVLKNIDKFLQQQTNHKIQITETQIIEEEHTFVKSTTDCWKSLVFCSGEDLYQEHLQIDPTIKHKCFDDIEKDIDRTFPQIKQFQQQQKKIEFKQTLQKISLYFPRLGYTQGINFIVGYLFLEGFNKQDTFWMIVHLFLKKDYLFLGFFQDGFPLSQIYCRFFSHLFKRHCKSLSDHFERLNVCDKMWTFKWFITTYIYSLPLQAISPIWDYIMVVGGLGLVYFAISLMKSLQTQLKAMKQDTEIIQFFASLRQSEVFHSLVNLPFVLLNSYTFKLEKEEIQNIAKQLNEIEQMNNPYVDFFTNYCNYQKRNNIIEDWHRKKSVQRIEFFSKHLKMSKLEWKTDESWFRVKKQSNQKEVIKLPKIIKIQEQSPIQIRSKKEYSNLMNYIQTIDMRGDLSEQKQIGQYVSKITFKKKKSMQNQEIGVGTPYIQKDLSEKVLPKRVPRRIKRRQSKLSSISIRSLQQSQHISVAKPSMSIASEGAIEETVQQLCISDQFLQTESMR